MNGPVDTTVHDERLQDLFRDGVVAEDLPTVFPLLRGRGLLRAFSALFHGSEAQVLLRLLVLRTIGARTHATEWTPQEIRDQLAFVDPVKLETVVQRLKDHDLLVYDTETLRYRVGPVGRKALGALATMLEFENDDDDGLGYLTAQLAAGQAVGRVSVDELGHLLSRLTELKEDFDRAVLSGSEHRIRRAAERLDSVWIWVEKGTEIVAAITEGDELEPVAHRLAQAVGRAQSGLLRQAGVFQRELNKIDQHRVHLGRTGLSSSDLVGWLRAQDVDTLAAFEEGQLSLPLPAPFLHDQIALDVAEYELLERERLAAEVTTLPGAEEPPDTADLPMGEEDLRYLDDWHAELAAITAPRELADTLIGTDYALSAYRLSLLGLLGDPESAALEGGTADLARLPLALEIEPVLIDPELPQIALVSAGRLRPREPAKDTPDA
ncbi:hypothetical protein [Luteibacter aegosomatissinici]|uniref:hypothetical protein n=1 Tax=Luteibacter aegosomatissinici TaxID=2911539 RepID=UPI001FF996A6|nr:hypothetical protein [Luteibacter aegosomatissinici]UPG94035.1 hypothetical protein L2Y97_19780 [Luteibacter aegosomatissinici]